MTHQETSSLNSHSSTRHAEFHSFLSDHNKQDAATTSEHIVEEHRSLGGSIISRLDNGAFVGLIYKLLVFS